jgi:hypothetical protein
MPNPDPIARLESVPVSPFLINPRAVGAIAIVEDVLAVFHRDDRVVPRNHELIGQHNVIVWVTANGQTLAGDGESLLCQGALGRD